MSGYSIKISAKLIVDNKDPGAMADAAKALAELKFCLQKQGLSDVEVSPRYHDRLTADVAAEPAAKAAE